MSSSGSQKKSPRELVIEHGEKMLLGLVALFALICVATTQWGTYEKRPQEFLTKVEAGKAAFANSTWPEDEKEKFEARDPGDEVARLLDGVESDATYEYTVKWFHRITPAREKVLEPDYVPIEDLVADAGRVLIELLPEQPEGSSSDIVVASADQANDSNNGSAEDNLDVSGPRVEGPRVEGPRPGNESAAGSSPEDYISENPYVTEGGAEPYAGEGSGYQQQRNVEPRGSRFVAVRGVFPMKEQVQKVQKALHLDTPQEAYQHVQFWDFEIQRQTAQEGKNPWSSEWEPVDIDVAVKLLSRTEFDVDVVDEQYRDAVFTMPLPYRVSGNWREARGRNGRNGVLASHPRIKRLLSEKERLEQEARAAAAIQAAERTQKMKESLGRGFKQVQVDTRELRSQMAGDAEAMSAYTESYSETMSELDPEYEPSSGGYSGQRQGSYGAYGQTQIVATPELLLFRFLDFSVVPGNAYRYRARLKLLNPNFDRDPGELADFSSREGKYRHTPWSDISTPAIVRNQSEIYIAKVDPRRGVALDAYQWMTETGSYVHGPFEKLRRGDRVASRVREEQRRRSTVTVGGVQTEVLRPSENTFRQETIDYVTPYTLIDFVERRTLNPEAHPDLELDSKPLSEIQEEVVLSNRFGELVRKDNASQQSSYANAKARMEEQDRLWGGLKEDTRPGSPGDISELLAGGEYAGEYGGGEYGGMEDYPGAGSSSRRRRSSTKRGGRDYQQRRQQMMMQEGGNF